MTVKTFGWVVEVTPLGPSPALRFNVAEPDKVQAVDAVRRRVREASGANVAATEAAVEPCGVWRPAHETRRRQPRRLTIGAAAPQKFIAFTVCYPRLWLSGASIRGASPPEGAAPMTIAPPLTRSAKKAAPRKSAKTLAKAVHEPVRKSARDAPKPSCSSRGRPSSSPSVRAAAAPIRARATSRSMRRTPICSFRRKPTPASCPTCASRSPTRTCAWSAAAGRARSPCASCRCRPTWPASTCASTPALSARCIGTRKPSGRTCSTATRASPSSMRRAAAS